MQGIDAFLDTYVRIDEGTAVLLCSHRSCVRTAAWLFAALVTRHAPADVVLFDDDDAKSEKAIFTSLATLRSPNPRRVAIIVLEPGAPAFQDALAEAQGDNPEKTPVYRVSGRTPGIFEQAFGPDKRARIEAAFSPDALPEEWGTEMDPGLSPSDIDELLAVCDTEQGNLEDHEIEEIASMCDEEIGTLTDEEMAALAELEDSELLEIAATWGEEDFRVLA